MKMYVVIRKRGEDGNTENMILKNIIFCPVSFKWNKLYFHETLFKHFVILAFMEFKGKVVVHILLQIND